MKKEFLESPIYKENLVSKEFNTTALIINLKENSNIVNLNVSVVGKRELFDLKKLINLKKVKVNDLTFQYRKVYFGGKWFDTKVFWRDDLPEKYKISGPAIVEQMDSTIVINPNDKAVVDNFGKLIIDIG